MNLRTTLAATSVAAIAGLASAASETTSFTNIDVNNGGVSVNFTLTGGFNLNTFSWAGTASDNGTGTFGSDMQVTLQAPGGASAPFTLGSGGSGFGIANFSGTAFGGGLGALSGVSTAGMWTATFDDFFDDGPDPEHTWQSLDFTFSDVIPPVGSGAFPATFSPFVTQTLNPGDMFSGTTAGGTNNFEFNELDPGNINATPYDGNDQVFLINHPGGFADLLFEQEGIEGFVAGQDLDFRIVEIEGVFSDLNTVLNEAAEGSLNIGSATERLTYSNLAAGTYAVLVDTWIGDGGPDGGAFKLTYNIPAPSSLALVGLGGLAAARRRRA